MRKILTLILAILLCGGTQLNIVYGVETPLAEGIILAEDKNLMDGSGEEEAEAQEDQENQEVKSTLHIKALNPGFTIDGVRDSGEFIELARNGEEEKDLSGVQLIYYNTSGSEVLLYEFADGAKMTADNLILRLSKTAEAESFDDVYTASLALAAGPLILLDNGEVLDRICWTGKTGCYQSFQSKNPTSLVRDEDGDFSHQTDYLPEYKYSLLLPEQLEIEETAREENKAAAEVCQNLQITEIYAYYAMDTSEQFVEIWNYSENDLDLALCNLEYRKKTYPLSGKLEGGQYLALWPADFNFSLTKNPAKQNEVKITAADGRVVDVVEYPHGQKKSTSYALIIDAQNSESWVQTYVPTPGAANFYQEYRNCLEGYIVNPATGNCVKQEMTKTKTCPVGQELNPTTNRCRKVATAAAAKTCAEGYELNPLTNRCRKKKTKNEGADYVLTPNTSGEKTNFVAFGVVAAIIVVGGGYIIWQFRDDINKKWHKMRLRRQVKLHKKDK